MTDPDAKVVLRLWHAIIGHPAQDCIEEGNGCRLRCRCGWWFGLYDLYPWMGGGTDD